LPENNALAGLCGAMVEAWKLMNNTNGAILFIVEDVTYNICDQRFHEFELRERYPHIKVLRKTLTEMFQQSSLGPNKELFVRSAVINVVYFRAGYEPLHYHSQDEWNARLMIERSTAIKCPSINIHLAGAKKVQQALAKEGILEKFLKNDEDVKKVKEIFTGLYSLDKNEGGDQIVEMVLKRPQDFVMKPQREGERSSFFLNLIFVI
jgi:glutathione synthase